MSIQQWLVFIAIFILLILKTSKSDVFILFAAYLLYIAFVIPLSDINYYLWSAALNLVVGIFLHTTNKQAAICSYILVPLNLFGFFLWYKYYPPTIYDNIGLLILAIQLVTVLPRGLLNGPRDSIEHIMDEPVNFNSIKTSVTMHKIKQIKKAEK